MAQKMGIFADIVVDNRTSHLPLGILRGIARAEYDVIYDLQCCGRTRKRYFTALRWLSRKPYRWIDARTKVATTISKKHAWGCGSSTAETLDLAWSPTDLSFLKSDNPELDKLPERYVLLICGCSPPTRSSAGPCRISASWQTAWRSGASPPCSSAPMRRRRRLAR